MATEYSNGPEHFVLSFIAGRAKGNYGEVEKCWTLRYAVGNNSFHVHRLPWVICWTDRLAALPSPRCKEPAFSSRSFRDSNLRMNSITTVKHESRGYSIRRILYFPEAVTIGRGHSAGGMARMHILRENHA